MDPLTIVAAGGMRARMESLDMLANNLANTSTSGYKADREFYSLYVSPEAAAANIDPHLPLIERPWTDHSQGNLQSTAKPLDLALDGDGLFVVSGPSGPLYTRNGNFRMRPDGIVTTQEDYALQRSDGRPLQLDPRQRVDIAADGSVSQEGQVVGTLQVVSFGSDANLDKFGRNYFQVTNSGAAQRSTAQVRQGSLENSNVSPAESAVRLVTIMRQFEMLQKAISIGADMNRRAAEEVAKV